MNTIRLLASQPWVESLGWTLVHFLWQGVVIAGVYAITRVLTARSAPKTRYFLACAALAAMVAAPPVTLLFLPPAESALAIRDAAAGGAPEVATAGGSGTLPTLVQSAVAAMEPIGTMPWVVLFWLTGTTALSIRLIGGWAAALRLRTVMIRPAPPEWQRRLEELGARIGQLRPVRLMVSGMVQAPSVIGYLRPMVLVPVGALTGLPVAHIEALLLHELAHIRRHDYVVNILQSAAEALLFYHPGVWWVSGHIRGEREMCCDDIAVDATGDAFGYAQALVCMASGRDWQPEMVLGASGGSLTARIARLLGQSERGGRRSSGPGAIAGAILLASAAFGLLAQDGPRPRFEVASIKPSAEQRFMTVRPQPGRLTANAPVRLLMQNAYTLQPFQILGGPSWIDTDYYEIDAKTEGTPPRPQLFLMLQSLLEERFQLKVKRETRELPVYALVAGRGGLKLNTQEGSCVARELNAPPAPPPPGQVPCGSVMVSLNPGGGRLAGGKVPMSELARVLSTVLRRQVIDRTGYAETFDVKIDFTPDEATAGLPRAMGPAGAAPPSDTAAPSIFTGLQEQLGIRLDSTKGPVEVLVIDSVQRPTVN